MTDLIHLDPIGWFWVGLTIVLCVCATLGIGARRSASPVQPYRPRGILDDHYAAARPDSALRIEPCRWWEGCAPNLRRTVGMWQVRCSNCGARSPKAGVQKDAIARWNRMCTSRP